MFQAQFQSNTHTNMKISLYRTQSNIKINKKGQKHKPGHNLPYKKKFTTDATTMQKTCLGNKTQKKRGRRGMGRG